MTPAKIIFYVVMLSLLGLGAYRGVLPTKAGLVRRRDDPKGFNIGLIFYFMAIIAIPWIV